MTPYRKPPKGVTVRDIADALGVSVQQVYRIRVMNPPTLFIDETTEPPTIRYEPRTPGRKRTAL